MGREQIAVKTALASPVTLEKVWAFEGTRPQRITEYHIFRRFAGRKDSCGVSQNGSFSEGYGMVLEPIREFLLAEAAVGEVEEGEVDVFFRCNDIPAVSVQKSDGND
jgi:hypothetical protein